MGLFPSKDGKGKLKNNPFIMNNPFFGELRRNIPGKHPAELPPVAN